jgi:hypothetical protein
MTVPVNYIVRTVPAVATLEYLEVVTSASKHVRGDGASCDHEPHPDKSLPTTQIYIGNTHKSYGGGGVHAYDRRH